MSAGGHFMFGQNGDGSGDLRNHEQLFNGSGVHAANSVVSGNVSGSHVNVNKKYSNCSSDSAANLTINNAQFPPGQSNNSATPLYKRNNAAGATASHNVSVISSQQPQQIAINASSYTSSSPSSSSVHLSAQNQSYSTVTSQSTIKTPPAPVAATPRLHSEFMSAANTAIRIKAACNGNVYISSVDSNFSLDEFIDHIQTICNIEPAGNANSANTSSTYPNGRFPAGATTAANSSAASPMPISHSQQSSSVSNSFANDSAFSLSSVDCSPETSGCTIKWIDEDGDPCTIESEYELQEAMRQFYVNKEHEIRLYVFPGKPSRPGEPCEGEAKDIYRRGARRWRRLYKINGHSFAARRFGKRALCIICRDVIWGLGRQGFRCIQCKMMVHKKCHKRVAIACGESYEHVTRSLPTQKREEKPDMRKTSHHSEGKRVGAHGNQGDSTSFHERSQEVLFREDIPDSNLPLPQPPHFTHPSNSPTKAETADRSNLPPAPSNQMFSISMRDFNLLKVIGRGSFAKVLLAEYKRTGKRYAMKVIKKESIHDDEDIDCVQTEKNVFEIATNHPFLVGLHSCFQTPSRLIFVIEFVSGGDLMYHMQRQKKLPEEHGRFYAAEISSALHFLHDRGIIYRDLKLDNVLLDNEGHIKLTDYGMCKENMGYYDTTGTFCGTPNYIAPELLTGAEYGFSVDWWALGVLTYEMLAGRSPFDLLNVDNVQNTEEYLFQIILEKPIRIPRSLSPKASAVLKGFLNKNPDDRLGCDPVAGYSQIQNHPFFRAVDWDALERKQIEPPFKPTIEDDHDLNNFDPQFTDEPVEFTPEKSGMLDAIDQTEFEGFDYVNPLLMSSEDNV